MKDAISVLLLLIFLYPITIKVDEIFFRGRYFNRKKITGREFLEILHAILNEKEKPIEEWAEVPQDWVNDKMYIPLQNYNYDLYRAQIVDSIQQNKDSRWLSPETTLLIEKIIEECLLATKKSYFITGLRKDAQSHRNGYFSEIGGEFFAIDDLLPENDPLRGIPLSFWGTWVDAVEHDFMVNLCSPEISKSEWPDLAELIADSLENNLPIVESKLLNNFAPKKS